MAHEQGRDPEWAPSFTPFSVDLYDAVQTAEGPYAVGGGGTVARKREGEWETVVPNGPSGQGSKLRAIAATDEGHRVWFAGSSGALGMYDLRTGEKQDYSYTGDATTSWREITVAGTAGGERALLANGSGVVVSFAVDGTELTFSEPTEPGQGDAVQAMATTEEGVGYAVDGAGAAYRANPEGWTKLGTVNAGTSLTDVYADSEGRVLVSATDGQLYEYKREEETWTPIEVTPSALLAVDVFQGHVVVLATGATLYSRPLSGNDTWHRTEAKTGNNLVALALGYPDVAVGKSGTIVERPRGKPAEEHERGEKRDPAPPVDPCRVLTEEMVERLGSHEVLELVEEYGCTTPFTETVAERLELRHLAERYHRHGEPIREVTQGLVERVRASEHYSLCCALCHEQVVPRERACECCVEPKRRGERKRKAASKRKAETKRGGERKRKAASRRREERKRETERKRKAERKQHAETKRSAEGKRKKSHGHACACREKPERSKHAPTERCLTCSRCGHAAFYVCRGNCGETHARHEHHEGHHRQHEHSHHDCHHHDHHGCSHHDHHGCSHHERHSHHGCGHRKRGCCCDNHATRGHGSHDKHRTCGDHYTHRTCGCGK